MALNCTLVDIDSIFLTSVQGTYFYQVIFGTKFKFSENQSTLRFHYSYWDWDQGIMYTGSRDPGWICNRVWFLLSVWFVWYWEFLLSDQTRNWFFQVISKSQLNQNIENINIFFFSDAQRIGLIQSLISEKYEDKILVAHDIHTKHRLEKFGGKKLLIRGLT